MAQDRPGPQIGSETGFWKLGRDEIFRNICIVWLFESEPRPNPCTALSLFVCGSLCVCMCACVHCLCACMCVCICVRVYAWVCVCVCTFGCAVVCLHACTRVRPMSAVFLCSIWRDQKDVRNHSGRRSTQSLVVQSLGGSMWVHFVGSFMRLILVFLLNLQTLILDVCL